MSFIEQLQRVWRNNSSMLCVGLDPEPSRFPPELRETADAVFVFCKTIVDATADLVCCFKPQFAHFAALRAEGSLERLIAYIHEQHPGVPVILDTKRGDIGSTAQFYAAEAFDRYRADAVTVNPYLGRDSVQPFLDRSDRGVVVLCRTSNPGARDLQDLMVSSPTGNAMPLYQHVARTVAHDWNEHGNCMLVVGATYPRELAEVRALVGNMPLLVPGIGAQGGDVAAVVQNGKDARGQGLVISSSRSILYASRASDFAAQARNSAAQLRAQITESLLM